MEQMSLEQLKAAGPAGFEEVKRRYEYVFPESSPATQADMMAQLEIYSNIAGFKLSNLPLADYRSRNFPHWLAGADVDSIVTYWQSINYLMASMFRNASYVISNEDIRQLLSINNDGNNIQRIDTFKKTNGLTKNYRGFDRYESMLSLMGFMDNREHMEYLSEQREGRIYTRPSRTDIPTAAAEALRIYDAADTPEKRALFHGFYQNVSDAIKDLPNMNNIESYRSSEFDHVVNKVIDVWEKYQVSSGSPSFEGHFIKRINPRDVGPLPTDNAVEGHVMTELRDIIGQQWQEQDQDQQRQQRQQPQQRQQRQQPQQRQQRQDRQRAQRQEHERVARVRAQTLQRLQRQERQNLQRQEKQARETIKKAEDSKCFDTDSKGRPLDPVMYDELDMDKDIVISIYNPESRKTHCFNLSTLMGHWGNMMERRQFRVITGDRDGRVEPGTPLLTVPHHAFQEKFLHPYDTIKVLQNVTGTGKTTFVLMPSDIELRQVGVHAVSEFPLINIRLYKLRYAV